MLGVGQEVMNAVMAERTTGLAILRSIMYPYVIKQEIAEILLRTKMTGFTRSNTNRCKLIGKSEHGRDRGIQLPCLHKGRQHRNGTKREWRGKGEREEGGEIGLRWWPRGKFYGDGALMGPG